MTLLVRVQITIPITAHGREHWLWTIEREKKVFVTEVSIEIFPTLEKWDGKLKKKDEVNSTHFICGFFFYDRLGKGCCCFFGEEGEASLVAQAVKNLLAMQETWVWSLGQEDPLEKGMTPVFLPGESHGERSLAGYSPWVAKSQILLSD